MTTNPSQPPPLPVTSLRRFAFEPMPDSRSPLSLIEALLKFPGRIIYELQHNWQARISVALLLFALLATGAYGVVVGTFAGGAQMWIAPAKIALGTLLSIGICLPSLYIFACLGGIDVRFRTVAGTFFAAVALGALLLIGFAPVGWIFSQSTDSVAFISMLHIGLWGIGIIFGLRLLDGMAQMLTGSGRAQLKLWGFIFVIVCLQMMTTLRPIVGKSDHFLPSERKFFMEHWSETIFGPAKPAGPPSD